MEYGTVIHGMLIHPWSCATDRLGTASAACFIKSAFLGEEVQGVLQGNKLLTSMEDTREKRILISSQDSFEALGNSTEKVQSQEEKKF